MITNVSVILQMYCVICLEQRQRYHLGNIIQLVYIVVLVNMEAHATMLNGNFCLLCCGTLLIFRGWSVCMEIGLTLLSMRVKNPFYHAKFNIGTDAGLNVDKW